MRYFHQARLVVLYSIVQKQNFKNYYTTNLERCKNLNRSFSKLIHTTRFYEQEVVSKALRSTKPKSKRNKNQDFVDIKHVRTIGGKGGDGGISFLQLWVNDRAGPDGGDGGNGGHVIFEVSNNVKDLSHISSPIKAGSGEKGFNKECFGKNAEHTVIQVPVGTIVRNIEGKIIADLDQIGMMFVAARGGAGGHGNAFFKSDVQQTPKISEYGAEGEDLQYVLEIRSIAHIGLIGLPNAGKSTLLSAVSRAKPKVASYPFTTLKPHVGIILFDDYEQIVVADLPGLISDSHKNRGLGIQFLKHVERCAILLFILDVTSREPWVDLETLIYEIEQFNVKLMERPILIVANKMDLPEAQANLELFKQKTNWPIIPISAKMGINISTLLTEIRRLYDQIKEHSSNSVQNPV